MRPAVHHRQIVVILSTGLIGRNMPVSNVMRLINISAFPVSLLAKRTIFISTVTGDFFHLELVKTLLKVFGQANDCIHMKLCK